MEGAPDNARVRPLEFWRALMVGAWQHPRLVVRLAASAGLLVLSLIGVVLMALVAAVAIPVVLVVGLVLMGVRGVGSWVRGVGGGASADASGRRNVRVIRREDDGV